MISLEHPLFKLLIQEQKDIAQILDQVSSSTHEAQLIDLAKNLWETAELGHHHREEVYLFEAIYLKPKIKEGGPMCTLYFDCHINERVRENVERVVQHPVSETPDQTRMIQSQSPIIIPLEEHRSGKDLLQHILDKGTATPFDELKKWMFLYKKIQTDHFKKEQNCMYPMCTGLLTQDEADRIYEKWTKSKL